MFKLFLKNLVVGGHMMIAGAQIEGAEVEDVKKLLINVITEMRKEKS